MDVNTKACNVCGVLRREGNHWFCSFEDNQAFILVPAEQRLEFEAEWPKSAPIADLCGDACCAKRLAEWLHRQAGAA